MRPTRALVPPALAPLGLALFLAAGPAHAAPHGDVLLKDGRKFEDVDYEITGKRIKVKLKNGEIELSTDELLQAVPKAAADAGEGEAAPEVVVSPIDLASRCRLEPLPGWAPQATSSPLVRIYLTHAERDADLAVYIRRIGADLPDLNRLPKDVSDDIASDFAVRYARVGSTKVSPTTLFGSPALKLEAEVVEFGEKDKDKRKVTELRFRRFGLEYAITYSVAPADEGAMAHQVGQLFESFSFLPAISSSPDSYADYGRGFRLDRPNAEWQLLASPFDEENPAKLITGGGKTGAPADRAVLTVTCVQGVASDAALQELFKKRKANNKSFVAPTLEEARQGGAKVHKFKFEDFNPGEKKKKLFKGFAGFVRGRVIVATGVVPVTDEDAAKLEGDIDVALASLVLFDEEALKDTVQTASNAMLLVKQGSDASGARRYDEAVAKYDEALRLAPTFARALYLRGLAKKEKQDFDGSKVDFEAAAALDPSAGYDAELSTIYEAEAAAAERAKNWGEAVRLWQRVFRAARSDDKRRRLIQAATQHWNELKKKDVARNLATLERDLNGVRADEQVAEFLSRSYREGANILLREKEYSAAKAWARKAKAAAPTKPGKDEADKLLEQITQAQAKGK